MSLENGPRTTSPVRVKLTFRKQRSTWQMSYVDPRTGKTVSRVAGSDKTAAQSAAERWQAELRAKVGEMKPLRRMRRCRRPSVTAAEFQRLVDIVPSVVGNEHAWSWVQFLNAIRSGKPLAKTSKSERPTHRLLTMSIANIQRVITELGKKAGIDGAPITSHDLYSEIR